MLFTRRVIHVAAHIVLSALTVTELIPRVDAFSCVQGKPLMSHVGCDRVQQLGDDPIRPKNLALCTRRSRSRRLSVSPRPASFLEEFDNFDRRPREEPELDPDLKGSPGDTYVKCGKCKACYALDLKVLGRGRVLRCSVCQNQWFQSVERMLALPDNFLMKDWSEERTKRMQETAANLPQRSTKSLGIRLFVGSIPKRVSQEDLFAIFGNFGEVLEASLRMDDYGGSKGFAFVNMKTEEQASKAVEALNGIDIQGRAMVVRLANQAPGGGRGGVGAGDSPGRGRGGGISGGRDRRGGFQGMGRGGRRPGSGPPGRV